MFSRMARQAKVSVRRFSNEAETQLETWIKINDRMHIDAALKAEAAVSGVKADVAALRGEVKVDVATLRADFSTLRTEVGALKNDVSQVKTDVNDLRKGQIEIHKEMTSNTRLLLVAMFGTATLFFGANRYLDDKNINIKVTPKL